MFELVEKFDSEKPDFIIDMVSEAMELGRPAADHRAWGAIFEDVRDELAEKFGAGRECVEYDWRFLNGTANGVMSFHRDGTLYGCYRFNGFAR